jgi:Tfp pilus assembly protein PilO
MNNPLRNLPKAKLQQLVLVVILTVAIVNAASYFYLRLQWSAMDAVKDEIAKLRGEIDAVNQQLSQEAKNEKQRAQMQTFVNEQRKSLVTGDPLLWIVLEMASLADQNQMRLQTPRVGVKAPHPRQSNVQTYTTRLEFAGGYDQIGTFVRNLENRYLAAEIQAIQVAGSADGGPLRASLDIAFLMDNTSPPPAAPVAEKKPPEKK